MPFLLKGPFAIFFGGTAILTGLSNKVLLIREKMTVPQHTGPKRDVIPGHFGPLSATLDLKSGLKILLASFDRTPFSSIAFRTQEQRTTMSKLSSRQTSTRKNFLDEVRKSCSRQKKNCKSFSRQKKGAEILFATKKCVIHIIQKFSRLSVNFQDRPENI